MRQNDAGDFVISQEEMHILRQALFVTKHHTDDMFDGELEVITGYSPDAFSRLMTQVDDLREGRRPMDFDRIVELLAASIRLGYESEADDPNLSFPVPSDKELRWLAYWLAGEGWVKG